jgi:hypothetical protein
MHGSIGNSTRPNTAGRYRAGPNLYRQIAASGSGSWVLRYEMRGKKRWMGLGPLAVFSLKEAMARAREAQQQIYTGVDPDRCPPKSARHGGPQGHPDGRFRHGGTGVF